MVNTPFLDIRDKIIQLNSGYDERGLLGLAFHPEYAENGRFFVYYSAPLRDEAPDWFNHTSVISEFAVSVDNNVADENSERIVMQIDQPQGNHNGGTLAFGPDDNLYISLGDGGGGDDVAAGHVEDWYEFNAGGNGQDIELNLLGSILRIDVDGEEPYAVPSDNPFVEGEGLDEIYAYGFRNPYRFSFDMEGGNEMYVGDAGQELWEEVSIVESGKNYGWNVKEGTHCFSAENPQKSSRYMSR
ncbi:MAG: PQQ-dependent sugar dehydrogenase [Bacteroidales bacterium]|nr:PQQ-dependent sugar dehydrogenase [Bacteroidales bacterium]